MSPNLDWPDLVGRKLSQLDLRDAEATSQKEPRARQPPAGVSRVKSVGIELLAPGLVCLGVCGFPEQGRTNRPA